MGGVYIIKHQNEPVYKVGKADSYAKRMATFSIKLPFDIEPVLWLESDTPFALEGYLKTRWADKRVRGEWFALSFEDIEDLRREFSQTHSLCVRAPDFEMYLQSFLERKGDASFQNIFCACECLCEDVRRLVAARSGPEGAAIVDQALSQFFEQALTIWRYE